MKRLIIGSAGLLFLLASASAQYPGKGIAPTGMPLSQVEKVALPPMDNEALLRAELESREAGRAPHFAEPAEVDISPQTHGDWEQLPDGTAVWRLRIASPGALSLNFGFLEYYMPDGGRLFIYDPGQSQVMGPFTPADNEAHQQLWTPVLKGDGAVLEVQIPASLRQLIRLRLTSVNHDFMGFPEALSGACNLDVICGAGDGWPAVSGYREIIQSVAVYGLGGNTFCTGFLVNNARNDCTPYFITANHCGVTSANASSMVVYWNYQNSYCRLPGSVASGSPGDGQLDNYSAGAIYRAGYAATDFTLLELDDPLSNASQAFFAGWSRDAAPPEDTLACIHHPDGAEKRISFSFSDAYAGAWGSGSMPVPGGNHLVVPSWNVGATESGSSGAPLVNLQRRVVGQLRGGAASCGNNQYDSFGWFRYSWTGGGTSNTRLKDWLDPDGTNLLFLVGHWLSNCTAGIMVETINQEACIPGTAQYRVRVSGGFFQPAALSVSGLPSGVGAAFLPNPTAPGTVATLILSAYDLSTPSGLYTITIQAQDNFSSVQALAILKLFNQPPTAPTLIAPANGSAGQILAPDFQWAADPLAVSYDLQVAKDTGFTELACYLSGLAATHYQGVILEPASTYYFRVRGRNTCGAGPWPAPIGFSTAGVRCQSIPYTGPPEIISPQGSSFATSTIQVNDEGTVAGLVIRNIDISHTYVGDLSAYLRSPSGTVVQLFHRPGVPGTFYGCPGANLLLGFADDAPDTQAILEATCNNYPAISGMFQPIGVLSSLTGEPAQGTWKLTIIDHFDQDGGQINGWELGLCSAFPNVARLYAMEEDAFSCLEEPYTADFYIGSGFSGPVSLYLIGAPSGAHSSFSSNPASPGSFATLTIDSIAQIGSYPLIIVGADGQTNHFIEQELVVSAPPAVPQLLYPDDESPVFEDYPTFSWSPVAGADTFIFQIATDPAFQVIVKTAWVTTPFYTLDTPMSGNIYFWRVFAVNSCGISQGGKAFTFSLEGSVTGRTGSPGWPELQLFPNPAKGRLYIQWAGPPPEEETTVELYTLEGQLLIRQQFHSRLEISVGHLPAGVYLARLRNKRSVLSRKVIIH